MSLVSGPGRAGATSSDQELHTLKHVAYVKKLDAVGGFLKVILGVTMVDGDIEER